MSTTSEAMSNPPQEGMPPVFDPAPGQPGAPELPAAPANYQPTQQDAPASGSTGIIAIWLVAAFVVILNETTMNVALTSIMAEELAAGGVDAIGAATEIDLVEIQLEDLFLAELCFHCHCEDDLAQLATDITVVVEIDVARQLLGDRRSALRSIAALGPDPKGSGDANRINAGMHEISPVLDLDHRVLHFVRDFVDGNPPAKAWPQRLDHGAIGCADADHLPVGG